MVSTLESHPRYRGSLKVMPLSLTTDSHFRDAPLSGIPHLLFDHFVNPKCVCDLRVLRRMVRRLTAAKHVVHRGYNINSWKRLCIAYFIKHNMFGLVELSGKYGKPTSRSLYLPQLIIQSCFQVNASSSVHSAVANSVRSVIWTIM